MTHAAHSHSALEKRDVWDSLSHAADLTITASKEAKQRAMSLEAQNAELRLLLGMSLDVIKKGSFHPSVQNQVAGIKQQIMRVL